MMMEVIIIIVYLELTLFSSNLQSTEAELERLFSAPAKCGGLIPAFYGPEICRICALQVAGPCFAELTIDIQ